MATEKEINDAVNKGLMKAMFDMDAYAKKICPVDTGRLRASLKVRAMEGAIIISMDTTYAEAIEYGTKDMIAAHGPHDPEHPVKEWAAQTKRGATGQMMPVIRPTMLMAVDHFIPNRVREELNKLS